MRVRQYFNDSGLVLIVTGSWLHINTFGFIFFVISLLIYYCICLNMQVKPYCVSAVLLQVGIATIQCRSGTLALKLNMENNHSAVYCWQNCLLSPIERVITPSSNALWETSKVPSPFKLIKTNTSILRMRVYQRKSDAVGIRLPKCSLFRNTKFSSSSCLLVNISHFEHFECHFYVLFSWWFFRGPSLGWGWCSLS